MATKRIIKKEKIKEVSGLSGFMGSTEKKIIKRYNSQAEQNKPWWTYEKEKVWSGVEAAVSILESAQVTRRMLNIKFSRLYSNMEAIGFPYSNLMKASPENSTNNRVCANVIQSVIDTAASKIAKDQPKVSFITTGINDYFLKMKANKLTKFVAGVFKEAKVYENCELVFRDACVVGTGFLFIKEEEGEIKTEWCASDEIRVDELDGMKQKPRAMYRVTLVPRDLLILQYPEYEEKIISAVSALQGKVAVQSTTEMVRVIESWHLPGTKKSKDGVHCITIENCTLFYEEYKKDFFPIVPFRWYNRPLGYFGRSITEEIQTIQVEINKILRTIQQSQELIAVPIIFVPNEAEIAEDVLMSNLIARMVPYSGGMPPTIITPTAQNAETYNHLNWFWQKAYEIVGISASSANGQKPLGVDSAVAMREVSDIENGRFAMVANRWENFFVLVARIIVDMAKDLYTKNPDLAVTVAEKKMLREIKWKDVDLKNHPYDIQTFPTSQLPDSPAGRIQTITEYIQNQWISKERGMELLNLDPDLEGEVNMQTASLRLTEKWLTEMAEDGIYHKPEPFMNLQLAQQIAQGVYTMMLVDGLPEDRLQLIRQFIGEIAELLTPQAPPPQMPPGPQGSIPMGPVPATLPPQQPAGPPMGQ